MARFEVEVVFKGEATASLAADIEEEADVRVERGVTRVRIDRADPTTVHGVLARLDALGLEVLEVRRGDHPGPGEDPSPGRA